MNRRDFGTLLALGLVGLGLTGINKPNDKRVIHRLHLSHDLDGIPNLTYERVHMKDLRDGDIMCMEESSGVPVQCNGRGYFKVIGNPYLKNGHYEVQIGYPDIKELT